jgi:hypothetical protein
MGAPPQGPQAPGFLFPGAEYFNLAPERKIALQGRRRFNAINTSTSIPATTTGLGAQLSILLETGWIPGAGIYIHWFTGLYAPGDASGKLQISAARMGLSGITLQTDLDLGEPTATLTSPTNVINAITEREMLIAARDQLLIGSNTGNLFLTITINVNNADTAAHSFQISTKGMYSRLDGLLE